MAKRRKLLDLGWLKVREYDSRPDGDVEVGWDVTIKEDDLDIQFEAENTGGSNLRVGLGSEFAVSAEKNLGKYIVDVEVGEIRDRHVQLEFPSQESFSRFQHAVVGLRTPEIDQKRSPLADPIFDDQFEDSGGDAK